MIKFDNVKFGYKKKVSVLDELNLQIKSGECVLLLGESGCGKSTMLKMINGLIPHFYKGHMSGSVKIDEQDIAETKMYEISKKVGSVFQNPKSQFFNSDTTSEVAFALENSGVGREEMKARVAEVVDDLDISKLMHRSIFQLSGGEKQSIAIASVCALRPNVYTLDEPSANLDYKGIDSLCKLLTRLKNEEKTIVIAEHRIFYLMDIVDKVIFIDKGKVLWVKSRDEFLKTSDEELKELGLRSIDRPSLEVADYKQKNGVLQISDLEVGYPKLKIKLLEKVNLSADSGDIIGIVGCNGSGKSTLINAICGLTKFKKGQIVWHNKVCKGKSLVKKAYMVTQDASFSLFCDSVMEECELTDTKPTEQQIIQKLQEFSLDKFADCHPMSLSGGQKQRLAIVVSQLMDKELIIFDEPTSGLDYNNMLKVSNLVKQLAKMGKVIFIVSHDREFINSTCSSVYNVENYVASKIAKRTESHEIKTAILE